MRKVTTFFLLITLFSASASEETDITTCGIPNSEIPAFILNTYGYAELRQSNEIAIDEALIWEYSDDSYCDSDEYYEKLDESYAREMDKINESSSYSLAPLIRNGYKDKCRYQAIVSIENSPFKFLSKFKRRIQTMEVNGESTTWFVHENKNAIKFIDRHPKESIQECVKNGI